MKVRFAKTRKYITQMPVGILSSNILRFVQDHSLIFNLEPLHCVILRNSMLDSNTCLASTATTHTVPWSFENNIEVHPINAS